MSKIEELELKYLDEFEPQPEEDINRRKEIKVIGKNRPYVHIGTMGHIYVYDMSSIGSYREEIEVSEKYVGELAVMPDKELIGVSSETLNAFNTMTEEIEKYVEEKRQEAGVYISWSESDIQIDKRQLATGDIEHIKVELIEEIDERIVKAKQERIDNERQRLEQEAETKRIAEEEKKGILTFRGITIEDKRVVKFTSNQPIKELAFDNILKIKDKTLYHDKDMIERNNLEYDTNVWGIFIENAIKYNNGFTATLGDGREVKIKFDDKAHMTINGIKCPKNWATKVMRDYINDKADIQTKVEIYKKLGVRKQLLVGLETISCGEIGMRKQSLDIPIKITPNADERYADVEFALQTKQVEWDKLVDEFTSANKVSTHCWGAHRYNKFVSWGWTKKELLYYFKQLIVQENI